MRPSNGYAVYAQTHINGLKGRSVEAEALMKAARLLSDACDGSPGKLAAALSYNQKLWAIFQADVQDPANPLAEETKQNLLSLSRYMDVETANLLLRFDPEILQAMSDINRAIAAGLSSD